MAQNSLPVGVEEEPYTGMPGEGGTEQQVFEPVLAADDFELFKGLMVRKNIELELQALMHLQEQKGAIPECMSVDGLDKAGEIDREEMQLLQEAIRASKEEYEMEQRWRRSCILEPRTAQQEEEKPCRDRRSLQSTVHNQVSDCCADVPGPSSRHCSDVPDEPPGATGPPQPQAAGGSQTAQAPLSRVPSAGGVSAAACQPARACQSNGAGSAGKTQASKLQETRPKEVVASSKHNLSAEELRSREEYLRQQRDRLLASKREQLGSSQRQANDGKAPRPGRSDARSAGGDALQTGPAVAGRTAANQLAPTPAAAGKQDSSVEESQTLEQRKRVAHKLKEELLQKK